MAANGARKVDFNALEKIHPSDSTANMREWIEDLISNGTLWVGRK